LASLVKLRAALATLLLCAGSVAQAESLRCNGATASEGDSKLSVLYKCGQPVLAEAYCAPVFYAGTWNRVPAPIAGALVPCQPVEEWLYERGPGSLTATVRFRDGKVQSIRYGRLLP
jgi:hypothetical protein